MTDAARSKTEIFDAFTRLNHACQNGKSTSKWQPANQKPSVNKIKRYWRQAPGKVPIASFEVWLICSCSLASHSTDLQLS